jgi:hypothetical protein
LHASAACFEFFGFCGSKYKKKAKYPVGTFLHDGNCIAGAPDRELLPSNA